MTKENQAPIFTHKGWMLFCPVKLAGTYSEAPVVAARWAVLEPLLTVAHTVQAFVIFLCSLFIEDYEPNFYFRITGELK